MEKRMVRHVAKRSFQLAGVVGLTLVGAAAAWAQDPSAAPSARVPMLEQVGSTVLFSLLGIVLAIVGFKLFDLCIKFDIEREICEKNNLAAAILASAVVLGTCIIVAWVVHS